jgi:serine/threonine protein kinase/Leucine-rich repeat (LRR) protein
MVSDAMTNKTVEVFIAPTQPMDRLPPEQMENYPPSSIVTVEGGEKYRVQKVLGKGGMGVVYEATDLHCDRPIAMKLLSTGTDLGEDDFRRFVTEARITSGLEHPNIVPVHELGKDARGNTFFTMKCARGFTLADVLRDIRSGKPAAVEHFPLGRLLTIFQKICDAVAFAHSRGVIHRDLKPGNIMIGDYGEVLVVDWGLARATKPRGEANGDGFQASEAIAAAEEIQGASSVYNFDTGRTGLKTVSGRVLGTPGFMAPEHIRGDSAAIDARADVYSLGAILYAILTLHVPVSGQNITELLRRIFAGDIVAPADYYSDDSIGRSTETHTGPGSPHLPHCPGGRIPSMLSEITMKALAVSPSDRYQSVTELQKEIEDYQNGLIWHLVVDEDFSGDEWRSRWDVVGGRHEIVEGGLRLQGGEPQMLLLKRELAGDLRIEFECTQDGDYLNEVGCILDATRSERAWDTAVSGYQFKYGAFNNSLNILARGDRSIFIQPLLRDTVYHIRAERVGRRLSLTVNNREVTDVVDPNPLVGPNRRLVGLLGWVAQTTYRRVRIYTLGTPWRADLLDTAERHLFKGHYATASDLFQEVLASFPDADRTARAKAGLKAARDREEMLKRLPEWQALLAKAWPGAPIQLRMDSEGLTLEVWNAGIRDLVPLRDIPLSVLNCAGNQIEDLEPLRGMPLVVLKCEGNAVRSLEPLRGMRLTTLSCENCGIDSLDPLRGMPLGTLNCGQNPLKDGLEPLRGMPLTWLNCGRCGIESLEPLKGLPLTVLQCDGNRVSNLEPLGGMPMTVLSISGNQVSSLEPLRGMSLNTLHCGVNRIASLEPLRGMPLSMLSCHGNRIISIEPLKDMSFNALTCGGNLLTGIGPFIKNPPAGFQFDCDTISLQELEWIEKTWSRDFRQNYHSREIRTLIAIRKGDIAALRSYATPFNGHLYHFIPKVLRWADARVLCEKLGGHLVTITSREENEFIASMFPFGSWFWIGLNTTAQGQEWATGERFEYASFLNALHERALGPKVFCYRSWYSDNAPDTANCFMIEWDS